MNGLADTVIKIKNEILNLKEQKAKEISVLGVETKTATVNLRVEWGDWDLASTEAAYVTAVCQEPSLTTLTFNGNWDGRMYESCRQLENGDGTVTWVIAPTVFKENDYNTTSGFNLSFGVTVRSTSQFNLSVTYGSNPYTKVF